MAAIVGNQFKHSYDQIVAGRRNIPSINTSVSLHNRFSLLAEYLFDSGLSENFTPSALLHDIVEDILDKYRDGLAAYENSQSLNTTNIPITNHLKVK